MGSYLLVLAAPGCRPVRVPVAVGRNARETIDVTLYGTDEIPEGFVQVPGGRFVHQLDQRPHGPFQRSGLETEEFFLARFPVTCRAWAEFLNDLDRRGDRGGSPREDLPFGWGASLGPAEQRLPRKTPTAVFYWARNAEGRFAVPSAGGASRLELASAPWEEGWPVTSVSWEDLMAFAVGETARTGFVHTLPSSFKWQKAALGPDARAFPFGNEFDATFMNSAGSHEGANRLVPVEAFPADESVYGARGLGGNSSDRCLDNPGPKMPFLRLIRGGRFTTSGTISFLTRAGASPMNDVNPAIGGRLLLVTRLGSAGGP